jgi:WD40 repeat protein
VAHGRHISILDSHTSDPLPASVVHLRWANHGNGESGLVSCGHGFVREFDSDLSSWCDANLVWGGTVERSDWSHDGRWAAAGTRGTTNYLWPRPHAGVRAGSMVDPAIHVHVLPCPTSDGRLTSFDPTGRYLGVGTTNGGLAVFDLDEVHPIAGPPGRLLPLFCRVKAFAWWPDAPVAVLGVATPTGGGGLLLVRCDDRAAPVGVVDLDAPVTHVAWSPHGGPLAVACENGAVSVFERDTEWDWAASDGRWDVTDQL